MEIQNDDVTTLTHGELQMPQVRPHVWEVPPELGEHLLRFPHHGWRVPDLVEPEFRPPAVHVPTPVRIDPEPVPVVDVLAQQDAADGDDEPEVTPEVAEVAPEPQWAAQPPLDSPAVVAARRMSTGDTIVDMALRAGRPGITTAQAVEALGRVAYNAFGPLVDEGRLVRVGRGQYRHPDFA